MFGLKVDALYRIHCKNNSVGMSSFGNRQFLYISDEGFGLTDENDARLIIPRNSIHMTPADPWGLQLTEDCEGE
jgi:hypothetical protein